MSKKKKTTQSVQDFIPVKNICHGVIETTDGRYIRILEIEPINFTLRSASEQHAIISTFASWLKISPIKLQFKSVTRKADSEHYISTLKKDLAIAIGNVFLIPVTAIALAAIPFAYLKSTINYYENHIKEELETALSIITTSYLRNDDIVLAIRENVEYLKPPMKEIFATFVTENTMITSDIRQSLRHLKDKIDNLVFREWCDVAIACQDDRTLKDTLMPIVGKLTDIRLPCLHA